MPLVIDRQVQVVAAVIERSGRYLLGKRHPRKASAAGFWCPISGAVEAGETEEQALVREVREETGLVVAPVRKLCAAVTRDGTALLHWWLVRVVAGEAALRNDEHTELRWATLEELRSLEPAFPEDIAIFERAALPP